MQKVVHFTDQQVIFNVLTHRLLVDLSVKTNYLSNRGLKKPHANVFRGYFKGV